LTADDPPGPPPDVVIGNTPVLASGDVFADDVAELEADDVVVEVGEWDGRDVTMKPLFSLLAVAESADVDSLIMDVGGGDGERDIEGWD
jgi:hypothetical protein